MIMSLFGAVCMAVTTASLTTAAELAPEEAWLVRKIETQEELRKRERCALALMQACVRVWIAGRNLRKQGPGLGHEERIQRHIKARKAAAQAFRHVSGHVAQLTRVHNLGVLHTSMDGLRSDQQKLAKRMDQLLIAMNARRLSNLWAPSTAPTKAKLRPLDNRKTDDSMTPTSTPREDGNE